METASPETISAALAIIEEHPTPTSVTALPSSETDEPNCWVLKWSGPYTFLLVYLHCGNDHVVLDGKTRVWVSLDDLRLYSPSVETPEPVGTGGHYCIDVDPLDGLTAALHAALAVPLNI